MAKTSYRTGDKLKFPMWLVFHRNGTVRLTRTAGQVSRDERALFLDATLPISLWDTPSLRASLEVQSAEPGAEVRLDVVAASEALKGALGVDIDLRVVPGSPSTIPTPASGIGEGDE